MPTLKKIKNANAQADTDRQENKMTITEKLNIDNGLRGQVKEHQAVTTNKNNCLTKQYLDTNVEGWAVCFCLPPLWAS